jgi:uncharacterized protein (DUF1015 family)
MAEIVPFHGVRFAPRGGRALADLLAPPYAPASPEEREELLARSPHNVAHLTLGDPDAAPGNRHAAAAATWSAWLGEQLLQRDPAPSFYPLEQAFWAPDGSHVRRRGFLAALRLHDPGEGIVIPHERTHAAACADQLELLRATRVNLSAPLGLYADERGQVAAALDEATAEPALADVDTEDGVHLRLWRTDRPETMARLAALVEDQRILLADGHHRYATALAYERELDAADPGAPSSGGHRYLLMMLCALSDPGLVVYPVHRLLEAFPELSLGRLLEGLPRFFTVETLEEDMRRPAGRAWAVSRLAEHANRSTAFLMISAQDGKARILTLRDDADLDAAGLAPGGNTRMIDVNVLHGVVFQHLLGLAPEALERQEHLTYVRDAQEAVSRVLSGEHPLGFLVNPAPMWQVRVLAEAGETMPARTTLFRPALPAGVVMREVDPHGPA